MQAEGTKFRPGCDIGRDITGRRAAAPATTRSSSRSAPPRPATCRSPGVNSPASSRRWSTCRTPKGRARATTPPSPIDAAASTSWSSAAATPARTASARPPAGRRVVTQLEILPARRASGRRPALADLADDLPRLLRARGERRAGLRGVHHRVRGRRQRPGQGPAPGRGEVRGRAPGPGGGHRAGDPGRAGAAGHGLRRPRARQRPDRPARAWPWTSAATSPATASTPPTCRACSSPATPGGGSR